MIISRIIGGLGNQMFQYAVGRMLALMHDRPLCLDISGFENYGRHHGFELERLFQCEFSVASRADVGCVLGQRGGALVRRILARREFSWLRGSTFVIEPHFQYWAGIRDVKPPVYLQGYWQSEKYFADIAATIRSDFTFTRPMSAENQAVADAIKNCTSVSLHIRRGDYVSDMQANAANGLCSIDYYRVAVQYLSSCTSAPELFIFSDDISWARENLQLDLPCHYVDHNGGLESYNDMRLMSLCRHHILANSTFSWWGAWLNPDPQKIVIAPKKWFADGRRCTDDLIPESWVLL